MKIAFTDILKVGKDDDKCCWNITDIEILNGVIKIHKFVI